MLSHVTSTVVVSVDAVVTADVGNAVACVVTLPVGRLGVVTPPDDVSIVVVVVEESDAPGTICPSGSVASGGTPPSTSQLNKLH